MRDSFIGFNLESNKEIGYNLDCMTQHAVVLGTTGSGKTVMCKALIEEALGQGIPVIAIDPKGDIGGLGITNKDFDFRPFTTNAEQTRSLYMSNLSNKSDLILDKLGKINTKIFTPKSSAGFSVSLIPELTAPTNFKQKLEEDSSLSDSLIEPLSESICQLSGLSSNYDKAKSLISSIIIHNWNLGLNLTLESLIAQILEPPFENLGILSMETFLKKQERTKIASSINLILSSPSKQAWKSGEKINIEKMFQPNNLSIFDLRHTGTLEEKQYAVEQILQEIYRFLLSRGGTDKLKYILYIDEVAGLLPPPPSSPPCKKSLEVLIRQARAFGLGILLATQNPGDIDYKMLGNIGTRFVGKLRTENDIEKVATAIGISPSILKQALINFKTGDFYYNNSVENKTMKIHCRWLYSFHSGPLQPKEIGWINHPETKPEIGLSLKPINTESQKVIIKNNIPKEYSAKAFEDIKSQTLKYSDKFQAFISESNSAQYNPILSVTIEPKKFKNLKFKNIGPYFFDLSTKKQFDQEKLNNQKWKQIRKFNFKISTKKISIKNSIYSSIKDSQNALKKKLYESKAIDAISDERNKLVGFNYNFMEQELASSAKILKNKSIMKEKKILLDLKDNRKKMNHFKNNLRAIKTGRLIKKMFGNKRLADKTTRIKNMEKIIKKLKTRERAIRLRLKKQKRQTSDKIQSLKNKLHEKSNTLTKIISYNPSRKDLIVRSDVFFIPTN